MDIKCFNTICYCCVVIIIYFMDVALTAVPEYFVEDHCSQTLALNYGTIESVRLGLTKSATYPDGMRCAMRIQAPQGKRLLVRFEKFDVNGLQDLQCSNGDYAQFIDGNNENSRALPGLPQRVCSPPTIKKFVTSGSFMVLRFISDTDMQSGRGIKLLITAFSEGQCSPDQFKCTGDGHCIQKSLECDGEYSCMDDSDEAMPKCLSTAAIAGIAVGGGILLILIIVIIVIALVLHERKRKARIIKRAMSSHRYPPKLWYESQLCPVDPSRVDPIWVGEPDDTTQSEDNYGNAVTRTCSSASTFKVSDCEKDNTNNETQSCEIVKGPKGQSMKKVPSSFWEIDLSELAIMAEALPPPTSEI